MDEVINEVTTIDRISQEELNKIKAYQSKAVYAATLAEKAYSDARVAELESHNYILTVYNKYRIVYGEDSITNDGLISRPDAKLNIEKTKE